LQINLSFLEEGEYVAEIYSDGANASGYASDFKKTIQRVTQKEKLDINLAPGGGWVARKIIVIKSVTFLNKQFDLFNCFFHLSVNLGFVKPNLFALFYIFFYH
jgi:hypothetical protein